MATTGRGPFSTQIVATGVITVGIAVLAAFWALSDPRAEIRDIKTNYLTVREHTEFANRVARDIDRLTQENKNEINREELNAITKARDAQLLEMQTEIHELQREVHDHERDDRGAMEKRNKP